MVLWMMMIGISIALLAISAGGRGGDVNMAYVHMLVAALVCIAFALLAIRESRKLEAANASPEEVAANTARYMGLIWTWGALGLMITYGFGILEWKEWWHFFVAFTVAAFACLFFAVRLRNAVTTGAGNPSLVNLARYANIAQLIGMVIIVLGLLIDGKMTRFLTVRYTDWAANNLFFFGALALAAVSANALMNERKNG